MVEYGSTFPDFFSRSGDVVTVNADDNAQAKTYIMQVTHSTPDNGDITYQTVTINIGWCVITHVDPPSTPSTSDASYIVFDVEKTITLTPNFAQVPACGYALVEDIQWTIPSTSPITEASDYSLTVVSTDGIAHNAVVPVIVQNFVEYDGENWSPLIEFDVTITDPCRTSTITAITLTTMEVILGEETLQAFSEAVDSAGTSYGTTVCGDRLYEVIDISTGDLTSVATVQTADAGGYEIRAYSTDEDNEGTHNLRLRVTFVNYPQSDSVDFPIVETNFMLTVNQAQCDCALITWDEPEQLTLTTGLMTSPPDTLTFTKATANEESKDASPAIRACYRNGGSCPTSSTIAIVENVSGVLDAAFMSITGTTLTVEPTVSS